MKHTAAAAAAAPTPTTTTTSTSENTPFHRVSLTLPPPNRSFPSTTHHALTRLLTACGIETSAAEIAGNGSDNNSASSSSSAMALRHWIPGVAELFHQSAAQQGSSPRQELQAIRSALLWSRSISLKFGGSLAAGSVLPQLEAAQKLLQLLELDTCKMKEHNLILKIGLGDGGFGIDSMGVMWLHAAAPETAWLEFLNDDSIVDRSLELQMAAYEVSQLERGAAETLGVGMVMASTVQLSSSTEYTEFLQRIKAAHSGSNSNSKSNSSGDGERFLPFRKVGLQVTPLDGGESVDAGAIFVPITSTSDAVAAAVLKFGPGAARVAEKAAHDENELSSLRTRVERKLRLRILVRDPQLPRSKFRAACLRMLHHSKELTPILDGLPIRVGEVNTFQPGQSHIDISWCFEV